MTVQRSYRYGDPAKVIEIEQENSCHDCRHKIRVFDKEVCALKNKKPVRRCNLYQGKETNSAKSND